MGLGRLTGARFQIKIRRARNAGILAAEIVALQDPNVKERLEKMREAWR